MNIAVISSTLIGGSGKQVRLLCSELARRGHSVTVFVSTNAQMPPEELNFTVIALGSELRLGRFGLVVSSYLFAVRLRRVELTPFDVVHGHGWELLGTRRTRRAICTFYGSAIDEVIHTRLTSLRRVGWAAYQSANAALEQVVGRLAHVTVGISPATQRRLPFVRHVIPCAVDLARYRPGSADCKTEHPTILSVGTTFVGRKRLWLLDEIFESVVRTVFPEAELWLVTNRDVAREGVRCFSGISESELIKLYQRAWIFCLPSTYEGFGVPYIEAMACGTPVLATPNPGAAWVLGGGRFGAIAPTSELGLALCQLLGSRKRRDLLADAGLGRAQQFSLARVTDEYLALYARLVEDGSDGIVKKASRAREVERLKCSGADNG